MAYNKTIWVNGVTPVDADNMNNIENGVSSLDTNKLDKSDVVNTKTESEGNGKALNAVQANPTVNGTLAQQINTLESNSLTIKSVVDTDFNDVVKQGIYRIINNNMTNKPPFTINYGILEVACIPSSGAIQQTAYGLADNSIFFRGKPSTSNSWSAWQQIATTTKTPFSCTAGVGFAITAQDCFTMNGMAYINVRVKKIDNTSIGAGQHFLVSNPYVPINRATVSYALFSDYNIESALLQTPFSVNCSVWDSNVYAVFGGNTAGSIQIFAQFKI